MPPRRTQDPSPLPEEAASGFLLAGGRSSRMGTDKAVALFHGRPLILVGLEILATAGLPARIAGCRTRLDNLGAETPDLLPDLIPDAGPLGGIHAALSASSARLNLFLPVDMPLMPPSLLACLLDRARLTGSPVTALRLNGRLEPFPVVLDLAVLPLLSEQLSLGRRTCRFAWQSLPRALGNALDAPAIETLHTLGHCRHPLSLPPVFWFQSANTPADLALLHRLRPFPPSASQPSGTLEA